MSRCPVCRSVRVVLLIGPTRRAFCTHCGSRWIQDGSVQRAIQRRNPPVAPDPAHLSGPPGGDRSA
jgi:Zn-finger nucleic acid-binding protein